MNKYLFIYQFLIRKYNSRNINWSFIFPIFGIVVGTIAVLLTISIMEGMEHSIFNQLKKISFPSKLENINQKYILNITKELDKKDIEFIKSLESQIILSNSSNFRIINIKGLEKFDTFRKNILKIDYIEENVYIAENKIYIGKNLSNKLNLSIGDVAYMSNPNRLNIFTGLPYTKRIIIAGVFDINLLDYNQNYVFCDYNLINNWIKNKNNMLLFTDKINTDVIKSIKDFYPDIKYTKWDHDHLSFISAMKVEKIIYTMIGFLIIIIAGFTLMSMMSLSVMKKIPQIGILLALGIRKNQIKYIFLIQSVFTSFFGSLLGVIFSYIMVYLNNKYNLINIIFSGNIPFNFPLILNASTVIYTSIFSLILLIIAGYYPATKASEINTIKAIGFKK